VLLTLRGKTGWREVEIGRGSSERTCPVAALETWLKFARIARGALFRAVVGRAVGSESLNDRHVARLVKRLAVAAGVRGDLSERDREERFSGHSLRAGLASSADDRRTLCPEAPAFVPGVAKGRRSGTAGEMGIFRTFRSKGRT
jgi:integrase